MRTIVLLAVVVSLSACRKDRKEAAERDKACQEAVADGPIAEARAWLDPAQTTHLGFEVGKDEMRELTDAFYAAGAVKVSAAYGEHEGVQISALLVVDLPADEASRRPVFAQYAESAPRYELDAVKDVGQSCLLVGLD